MKYKNTISSRSSIKKMKEYEFKEITEEDVKEGMKVDYDHKYLIQRGRNVFGLYKNHNGKLEVVFYHSFHSFELIH